MTASSSGENQLPMSSVPTALTNLFYRVAGAAAIRATPEEAPVGVAHERLRGGVEHQLDLQVPVLALGAVPQPRVGELGDVEPRRRQPRVPTADRDQGAVGVEQHRALAVDAQPL